MQDTEFEERLLENGFKKISYWEYESDEDIIRISKDCNTFEITSKNQSTYYEVDIPYAENDIVNIINSINNPYMRKSNFKEKSKSL